MEDKSITQIALVMQELKYINEAVNEVRVDIKDLKNDIKNTYLTKEEFKPYKRILDIASAILITAILSAVVALVIIKP